MSKTYFATVDGNVIDSVHIKNIAKIVTGKNIYSNDAIKHFAGFCGGIVAEIEYPYTQYIESLLKRGDKVSAVKIYRDTHYGVSRNEAIDAVNKIQKDMEL